MSGGGLAADVIAQAYIAACRLEVRTLKPGNVHIYAERPPHDRRRL